MRYPDGKAKAVTFNCDDGLPHRYAEENGTTFKIAARADEGLFRIRQFD